MSAFLGDVTGHAYNEEDPVGVGAAENLKQQGAVVCRWVTLIEVDSTLAGCEGALVLYEHKECQRAFEVCLSVVEVGKGNH